MPTYAIGDIHGCLGALQRLLGLVRPTRADTVVLLGDYVNRGPDTRGVLDRMLYLQNETNVIALRGNHDTAMIAARTSEEERSGWLRIGGTATVASYPGKSLDGVPAEHWSFLETTCRDWYETAAHIFVHATVDPKLAMDKQSPDDLYWNRLDERARPHHSGKTVVCGHTSQRSGVPLDLRHTICIDTGCVYGLWLTGLDVDTGEYWQVDNDGRSRSGRLKR